MGLAYSLSSFLGSYNRYGFFGIFAALNPTNLFPFCKALKEELNRLCQEGLQDEEVESASACGSVVSSEHPNPPSA